MSQNQNQQFDVHDANAVLQKYAQIRQALRQMDDDITGLIYIGVAQLQKEQKDASEKAQAEAKAAKEAEGSKIPYKEFRNADAVRDTLPSS